MEEQRARARESWKGSGDESLKETYKNLAAQNIKTEFVGYEGLEAEGKILKILKGDREVASAGAGEEVEIIADRTPFLRGIRRPARRPGRPFPKRIQDGSLPMLETAAGSDRSSWDHPRGFAQGGRCFVVSRSVRRAAAKPP